MGGKEITKVLFDVHFDLQLKKIDVLEDLFVHVDKMVASIFQPEIDQQNLHRDDCVGIGVEFGDEPQQFFRMSCLKNSPVSNFFDGLARLLQSKRDLLFTVWHVTLTFIRKPVGQGDMRMCRHADVYSKKSMVKIRNDDSLCLWRSIVVARASHEKKAGLLTENQYKVIASSQKRNQQVLAQELKATTCTNAGNFDDVLKISRHIKKNITVVNPLVNNWIEFRTADQHPDGTYRVQDWVSECVNAWVSS